MTPLAAVTRWLLVCVALVAPLGIALAHNVVGAVFVSGNLLEGEFGFSNGELAGPGSEVSLLAPDGAVVASTVTDDQGAFQFRLTSVAAYRVVGDLGLGHQLTIDVVPSDIHLPNGEVAAAAIEQPASAGAMSVQPLNRLDQDAIAAAVEASVARQLKPLRRDFIAMQHAVRMSDVFGGIGVIFGLCGLAALWMANKKQHRSNLASRDGDT